MRLDKILANSGYGSRKDVKKLLRGKAVTVNGVVAKDAAAHVDPQKDMIFVGDEQVRYQEFIYLLMNKPAGVISATEDRVHETVLDLLSEVDFSREPFPVGRLDIDTEGLLILTNDGKFAHEVLSPKKHVDKTYYAKIAGVVTEADVVAFSQGVILKGNATKGEADYVTKPGKLVILATDEATQTSEIEVTITEGKFHQVKRMFESVGKTVVYLKRIQMGQLTLDEELPLGAYRELTDAELSLVVKRD
ncbi:MAG: pseudouridine synthase [Culicoidibacterales bacterium]